MANKLTVLFQKRTLGAVSWLGVFRGYASGIGETRCCAFFDVGPDRAQEGAPAKAGPEGVRVG